jgi:hypothetical protein
VLALIKMDKIMRIRLISAVAIAFILLALSPVTRSTQAQAEEPWKFLQDFTLVNGAVRPVNDDYIGAVLSNPVKGYFALVIYAGICRGQSCAVERPVAYFVIDTNGVLVRHHLEPGATLESMIGRFEIS